MTSCMQLQEIIPQITLSPYNVDNGKDGKPSDLKRSLT